MKNKIVIYGGSFNPPLNSHFLIAEQVLNQFKEVEKVIFVPVNKNYAKDGLIENRHRINMLKLIIEKNNNFLLSDIDMLQNRSLYTIEILEKFKNNFPDKEICFLLGSDNLKEFHTWKKPEEILSKFQIIVIARDKDDVNNIINESKMLKLYKENIKTLKESIRSNISSSFARNEIKHQNSIRYLTPDEIYYYIKENELYKEAEK